ncbi:hypothetical protein [Spiroplasma endosymbiont of Colias croceus]|uniref:hypothetical protein n=1 Tax=Spiroplasma endosymbiont of Colias croceus TaxID=3066310 RepID=UPI0030D15168
MFKNLTKGNKKEIEECQRKMKSSSENRKYLQQKIYFEWEKLDQINWRTEAERVIETNDTIRPLEQKLRKEEKIWINNYKQIEVIKNRPYCQEEKKQREALKSQEFEKLKHVRMNEPSVYHDGTFGILFDTVLKTGEKLKSSWNETNKIKINEIPSCSQWERRANSNPYSSPFK